MRVQPEDASERSAIAQLIVVPDGANFVLGRPSLRRYVMVPPAGAEFVRRVQVGDSLAEATLRASQVAGAPVDGIHFWAGLRSAGLLEAAQAAPPARLRVSAASAQRLFGPVAGSVYSVLGAAAIGLLILRPDLRPTFESAWFLPDPVLSMMIIVPIGLSLSALHETWHFLAGRAEGLTGRMRISFRGPFLVFETNLSQIVTLPRRRRYIPFLAGSAIDVTILGLALLIRFGHQQGRIALPPVIDRLLAAVVLVLLFSVVWQWAALFLRTDGYAVLANLLRCHNLYRATALVSRWRLWRLTPAQRIELDAMSQHDRSVASWFGAVQLAGIAVLTWAMLTYALPFIVGTLVWVSSDLGSGDLSSGRFWASAAVLCYLAVSYAGPLVLALRGARIGWLGRSR